MVAPGVGTLGGGLGGGASGAVVGGAAGALVGGVIDIGHAVQASGLGDRIKHAGLAIVAGVSALLPGIQPGESSELERQRRREEAEQVQEAARKDDDRPDQEPPRGGS